MRNDIKGLPFTDDGYDNTKTILKAEYGQAPHIVNVYVRNIMELHVITGANPRKVKEFYKKLCDNVQSFDTPERLYTKLKEVEADLVRGNEGWTDWGFKDLLREL